MRGFKPELLPLLSANKPTWRSEQAPRNPEVEWKRVSSPWFCQCLVSRDCSVAGRNESGQPLKEPRSLITWCQEVRSWWSGSEVRISSTVWEPLSQRKVFATQVSLKLPFEKSMRRCQICSLGEGAGESYTLENTWSRTRRECKLWYIAWFHFFRRQKLSRGVKPCSAQEAHQQNWPKHCRGRPNQNIKRS